MIKTNYNGGIMEESKVDYAIRACSYFVKIVMTFTTVLTLLFLADYYNRMDIWAMNILFVAALSVVGVLKVIKSRIKKG